jgi:hypothetical protein
MPQSAYEMVREFFLLAAREKAARVSTPEQTRRATALLAGASALSCAGEDLADAVQAAPAIVLFREAAHLLLAALLVEQGEEATQEEGDRADLQVTFARLVEAGKVPPPPPDVVEALRFVANPRCWEAVAAPAAEQARTKDTLEEAIRWLRQRLRVSALPAIRLARFLRIAAVGGVVLASFAWLIVWFLTPRNLALHRPVRSSSVNPKSVAPADGSGLVNGVRESNYGIHTDSEDSPWVMIDLQGSYAISDIEVYNRRDGWFDEGLPLVLELSQDGVSFTEVSRRTETFSQAVPWKYTGTGVRARYVRVRAPHRGYISLAEIEVHGKR